MARIGLTRDQLAKFLPNHEAVKAFEQLFEQTNTTIPSEIIELNILVNEALSLGGTADNKGDIALGLLANIAASLDVLAKAPPNQPVLVNLDEFKIEPRPELGTMAAQNAANVAITGGTLSGVAISGTGFVVGPATAIDGNVALFDGVTGDLIKDGGTLGSAAFTSSAAYDAAGAAAAAQAASQPLNAKLTNIGALASAAGWLHNDGAGTFVYSTPTAAQVGAPSGSGTSSGTNTGDVTLAGALTYLTIAGQVITRGAITLTSDVTGTLPVGNGGTGITSFGTGVATFLGTPSSANLAAAVTGETGSGALVFATSPTLVTPVLGVAAATSISFGNEALANYDEDAWNPTPTPAGGAFTTVSFVGTYTRIGRRVMCNGVLHITNKGTAAGTLLIALPFTPVASSVIIGWEDNAVGKVVTGTSTGANMELRMADGTTIYVNGANMVLFCSFDI